MKVRLDGVYLLFWLWILGCEDELNDLDELDDLDVLGVLYDLDELDALDELDELDALDVLDALDCLDGLLDEDVSGWSLDGCWMDDVGWCWMMLKSVKNWLW